MALDQDGRPIPVFVPDPKEMSAMHNPQDTELVSQLKITQQKADEGLRVAAELAGRMMLLEKKVDEQLLNTIREFHEKFDTLMLDRMKNIQSQFEQLQKVQSEFIQHAQFALNKQMEEFRHQVEHMHDSIQTQVNDFAKQLPVPQPPGE